MQYSYIATSINLLKSIFELRILCETGLMPILIACDNCAVFEPDYLHFFYKEGNFLCDNCFHEIHNINALTLSQKITKSVLQAMRHIVFSDYDRLFYFKLNKENLTLLNVVTEKNLLFHLDKT